MFSDIDIYFCFCCFMKMCIFQHGFGFIDAWCWLIIPVLSTHVVLQCVIYICSTPHWYAEMVSTEYVTSTCVSYLLINNLHILFF